MTRLFDKFEILECLKKDSHSSVYLARHIYLGTRIVLKVLEIFPDKDRESLPRFKREARILARLDHPNIIKIIDFGISENQAYLSFEYFESENLSSLTKRTQLTEDQKSLLFRQLLQGLEAAHNGAVIHRDLKPENILINKNFQLKIADFGLAILQDDTKVTNKSSIVGTPAYMSPEQIRGESLAGSSDLFALGIIGFELFCGFNPFAGRDINETINAILSHPGNDLIGRSGKLNKPMPAILERLLTPKPGNRGTATEILSLMDVVPVAEKNLQPRKFNHVRPVLIFIALFLITTVIWLLVKDGNEDEQLPRESSITEKIVDSTKTLSVHENVAEFIPQQTEQKDGMLFFELQPAADLYLNDRLYFSNSRNGSLSLAPGEYQIRVLRADFPPFFRKISIKETETTQIIVNLDSLFGYFMCQVHPWGDITINDHHIGQTPLLKNIKMFPGRHLLLVENPNFQTFTDTIDIIPGKTTDIRIDLKTMSQQKDFY